MGLAEIPTPMAVSASDVVFAEATQEQRRLSWHLNSSAWAQPMTTEQYVEREADLSRTELTRDGGCKYWVLHKQDDPLAIIASCESIRKTVFVRRPRPANGVAAVNGNPISDTVEDAPAYGIASVYTNPAFRRLGMASLMLHKLQAFMDAEPATCSVLYSDIGKNYYTNLGWTSFSANEATLHLLKEDRKLLPESCCDVKARYLKRDEIRALCDADIADLKARLRALPQDGKVHLAFAPSYAQIEWHLIREEDNCRMLLQQTVEHRGAITNDAKGWITWDRDFKRKQLRILRIVVTGVESQPRRVDYVWALLGLAVAEASNWGFKSVAVWNPDSTTTSGIKATSNAYQNDVKVVFKERDGSIPCLRWRGGGDTKKTVWEDNYRYAWC